MNRRGHILRDASVDWAIGVMNDGHVIADFDSDLAGEGARRSQNRGNQLGQTNPRNRYTSNQ